jgi:DNA-binding NtrC family response regulator
MTRAPIRSRPAGAAESSAGAPGDSAFRVLVIDDEPVWAGAIARSLERRGVPTDVAHSAADGLRRVERERYGLVLLDHRLPDEDGLRLIPLLTAALPGVVVVMMTAYEAVTHAVQAIRLGAEDYLAKSPSVTPVVERALEVRERLRVRNHVQGWRDTSEEGLLGDAPGLRSVRRQLQLVARSPETTVLFHGESGAGKEVAARELHRLTFPDGTARFLAVDTGAVPGSLAESLLFGHEKGAFTGADRTRRGYFEEVGDGTLFLDEIGDMGLELQGKFLRALENRVFQRVGSAEERSLRARVVAATNRDLDEAVARGTFRFDLYQRLSVFPIRLPPLRERPEDIALLADHFAAFFAARLGRTLAPLGEEVRELLATYDYPGNVRELRNIMERAIIQTEDGRVRPSDLPERVVVAARRPLRPRGKSYTLDIVPGVDTLDSVHRTMIERALDEAGGVKAEAARLLGISRYQLLRRLERLGKDE